MAPDDFPAGGYTSDYLAFWGIWLLLAAGTVVFLWATRNRTGRARRVIGRLLVVAAMSWTLVLAGETWLRYVYDQTDSYGLTLTNWSWFRRHVQFNDDGFRDGPWRPEKPPGVERVACIGDSFTMGWGVEDPADCFPQRIGAALQMKAPGRVEVRNYGVAGFATSHEINLIDKRVAARDAVDRIIIGYCLNDPDDLLPPDRWFNRDEAPRVPFIEPTRSFLADFFWFRLKLSGDPRIRDYFGYEQEAYEDPVIWTKQRSQFRHIAETCRTAGIRLNVVVFPFFQAWGDDYRFAACHDKVVAAWRDLGVEAIDLREAYRGIPASELVANRLDAHPNERAHEIAAKTVLQRVFGVR